MNDLKIFEYENAEIRTIELDGITWFVGKDVAGILGYEATRNAIAAHVDPEDKLTHQINAAGQNREMILINESGLYSLIMSSKKQNAKAFKRWVTSEVIPSIRRTGNYTLEPKFKIPQTYPEALRLAADQYDEIERLESKNEFLAIENQALKPKAEYFDALRIMLSQVAFN